jgi:hypothetical protein
MIGLSGAYLIDGIDLWDNFGITLAKGSLDDFLKLPKRKESIQHNWMDEDGLDVDLSRNFYEAREINLRCYIIADTEALFWIHYNQFLSLLKKPGLRRFNVIVFGLNYYVFYKDCTIYDKLTPFKQTGKLFCSFNLQLVESVPGLNDTETFLVDTDDRFIIT